jgi:hypothetical protein
MFFKIFIVSEFSSNLNTTTPPGLMITDNRIFSSNFPVYGRLRGDTARKQAVFPRNSGYRNMAPYLCHIRSYACRILITNGRKTPTCITVKYGA